MKKNKQYPSLFLSVSMLSVLLSGCATTSPDTVSNETTVLETASTYQITEENNVPELVMNDQPESSYWFPEELLAWSPSDDNDLEFNKSIVPLAKRAERTALTPANATQNKETNVMAISIMNSSTSGNAPNGLNKSDCNTFAYWQYIDTLVYWGGSSGEGLIVPPSPDVTDTAHKNGVKVAGTIFFPQSAHGGKLEWLDQFLQKDDSGKFPIIDKLIEVATLYGFDGWFINQESEGSEEDPLTTEHASLMLEFISAFKTAAPNLEVIYYDSMTNDGKMDWQNALTNKNVDYMKKNMADSMFLNFWWTEDEFASLELLKSSKEKATENAIDPYSLYAGVDVQSEGYFTPINWSLFEASPNSTYTSLGLYCPNWAYSSASGMEDFWKKENSLWVNAAGDPSQTVTASREDQFKGISTYAIERTAITTLPFITNFNSGNGYSFFIKGEQVSKLDWNNRSISDVLPTYRYIITQDTQNTLKAVPDVANAYYGGQSLRLYGNTSANTITEIMLYSADLLVTDATTFSTIAKADVTTKLDAVVTLEDGSSVILSGNNPVEKDWTTVTYDISDVAGKRIRKLSYQMSTTESATNYSFYFGNISLTETTILQPSVVSDVVADNIEFDEDSMYAGVRLSWQSDIPSAYYEVYRINEDESRSLLGVSNKNNFYINTLPRTDETNRSVFEVVPVTENLEVGTSGQITIEWPDNSLPKAAFSADKTLITPGESVTFTSKCSENTKSVEWQFTGADTESSSEVNPSITYSKEGAYPVSIKAINDSGEASSTTDSFIIVSKEVGDELSLLSEKKETSATAYVNDNEAPPFAVDGDVTKKWCATGTPPHELTIDLGDIKTISAVDISHAEAGGESPDMNTKAYTISISEDGTTYEPIVSITRNTLGTTHDTFAPAKARYVKLSLIKPTQGSDSAARIYEVSVYGMDGILK